jgi:hypothetical protein
VPYRSKKQAAYIHARAAEGEGWAKKFVRDAHGTHVQKRRGKRRKRRAKR